MAKSIMNLSRRSLLKGIAGSALTIGSQLPSRAEEVNPKVISILSGWEQPMLVSLVSTSSLPLSAKVTEGLLAFDNNMQPLPQLATKWTVSEDGLDYEFTLRQGVKWHDGKDFTSADAAFSIKTLKEFHPRGRTTFAQVTSIEAPDTHTLRLKLSKPIPYLLVALSAAESPIVPAHIYEGKDVRTNPANNAPIGTGPYKFKEWVRGSHVEYVRNENYWDKGKPLVAGIVARTIPDLAARSIALETGQVDIAFRTPVPPNDVSRLAGNPQLHFEPKGYEYSPPNIITVEFNLERKTFSDIRVRQALAHCIDREMIAKVVYFGLATPCPSPVVAGLKLYHNDMPTPYKLDFDKANALLDEAGYKKDANGKRFSIVLDYRAGDDMKRLSDYLRASFARVGVALEGRAQDLATLGKRVYTDRDFDCQIASLSNLFDPQVGVQRLLWSKNIIKGVPFSNGMHYVNEEVDQLLEASSVELNQEERVRMWKRIQEIVMTEVPCLNIVFLDWKTVHNVRVTGHSDTASGFEGNFADLRVV